MPGDEVKALSKLQQALFAAEQLLKVRSFDPRKACNIYFESTDKDISALYERLSEARLAILNGSLSPSSFFAKPEKVNLDAFFTSEGVYVDQRAIVEVGKLVIEIINIINEKRRNSEPDAGYAERLLSKIFSTIVELEKAILIAV